MLAQVETKLNELKKQRIEEYYDKRESDLKTWGMVTKTGKKKKEVPLIVTDDEYEELLKATASVGKAGNNQIAQVALFSSYVALFFGVIAAFVVYQIAGGLALVYASFTVLAAIVVAIVLRSLAEIIRILQEVSNESHVFHPSQIVTEEKAQPVQPQAPIQPQPQPQPQPFPVQPQYQPTQYN